MRKELLRRSVSLLVLIIVSVVLFLDAKEAVTPVTWSAHSHNPACHMNMGPTGVRVWMRGYQLQVITVDMGSPADGVLERGDLICGAEGMEFGPEADPRMTLGNAIGAAEADDGLLKLRILRDGRKKTVKISLPVTGPFSDKWPYDCRKSKRILYEACDYLRAAQMPNGEVMTDGSAGLFPAGLLLLSAGEVRYMDSARRAAYAAAGKDFDKIDYSHWAKGYGLVFMAEYYLATGDATVLEKIKEVADQVAKGQMKCGSWGHNSPGGGYGAMNQAGVICAMGMVLAQECGVEVDRVALGKALDFFGRYAELGAVPYGDHMPGSAAPDDNGKSASSAVLFSLLPDCRNEAEVFSESIAMSYASRETGHTGGYFSMVWGPLGCAPRGLNALHEFMDYQAWYYNLSRTWKGALVLLPYKEALTRFDGSSYNEAGGEFTTGGMGLVFALPMKKLRILGAQRSVFGADLKGKLLKAREAYQARDWPAFDAVITSCDGKAEEEIRFVEQLKDAAEMMKATKARTLKEIKNNLDEGDAYRASEQYAALKRLLGEGDEDLISISNRFDNGTIQWYVREGKRYYEAWGGVKIAAVKSWVPYYGRQAKLLSWDVYDHAPKLWEDLSPTCEAVTNTWRVTRYSSDAELPRGWYKSDYDDLLWPECDGISGTSESGNVVLARRLFKIAQNEFLGLRLKLRMDRNATTDVYVNGTQVAHVVRGRRSGYAKIELDESSLAVLKKGENLLAVTCTRPGNGGNALDVGLQAVLAENPWDGPLMTGSPAEGSPNGTAIDRPLPSLPLKERISRSDQLKVQEALDRYHESLNLEYAGMSVEELADLLSSPVAYKRHLAETALVGKGREGLNAAVDALRSSDWRVRSSGCNIAAGLWSAKEADITADIEKQIPVIIELLADEHFWVRVCAAKALGSVGREAESATAALAKAATDQEEWVRVAAIAAIEKVTDDKIAMLSAARSAMMVPSTSFSVIGRSFRILEKNGADDAENLTAMIYAIEHPAEGMGANVLASVIERVLAIDQEKALPVLTKVAEGGYEYDRLRGDPRGKSIELLGGVGSEAKSALPALKRIVASERKEDGRYKEPAKNAIEKIVSSANKSD